MTAQTTAQPPQQATAQTTVQQADGSGAMFDRIAPRYDLLNRILSLGLDRRWRRDLVAAVMPPAGTDANVHVLDVATGTADVAIQLARTNLTAHVTGLDPSAGMLAVGREKTASAGLSERLDLIEGDGCALPFESDQFTGTCIAFGIRNVPDRPACLREMTRVTRPGGVVAVLELAEPEAGPLGSLARLHVRHIVPRIGGWLSGAGEYRYLQKSVAAFPPPEEFAAMMEQAGLVDVQVQRMSFGAAHLYCGRVPMKPT